MADLAGGDVDSAGTDAVAGVAAVDAPVQAMADPANGRRSIKLTCALTCALKSQSRCGFKATAAIAAPLRVGPDHKAGFRCQRVQRVTRSQNRCVLTGAAL